MQDKRRIIHTCVSPTKITVTHILCVDPVPVRDIFVIFSKFSYLCTIVNYSELDIDTVFLVAYDQIPNIQLYQLNS